MHKNVSTSIVYVFWKKVDGLLRIDVETFQNIVRTLLTNTRIGREYAPPITNQKDKLDERIIRTTDVLRTVREIPFGIVK